MKKVKRYSGEDDSLVEKDYGGSSGMGEYAPEPIKPKPRIVTKEELSKSGLSLRDFLNKERGLTRRGESAPSAPVAPPPAPEVVAEKTTTTTPVSAPTTPSVNKETYRDTSGKVQVKKSAAERDAEMAARRAKVAETVSGIGSSIGDMLSRGAKNFQSTYDNKREKKMAKGGSVSKASSRADGIAQRGKTRGKMC